MTEKQKTQGNAAENTATIVKKPKSKAEILGVKTGYCQHTSPNTKPACFSARRLHTTVYPILREAEQS